MSTRMTFHFACAGAHNHRTLMNEQNFIIERGPMNAEIVPNLHATSHLFAYAGGDGSASLRHSGGRLV
jgi:hypothetical protein